MLSHFSRVWLFMTPWTVALQAPLSMEFSRQEYWNGLPCPPLGDLPSPGMELVFTSPALAGRFFTTSTTWWGKEVLFYHIPRSEVKWNEVAQSCPTLCDPMDCSLPGSFLHGILQARLLEWVAQKETWQFLMKSTYNWHTTMKYSCENLLNTNLIKISVTIFQLIIKL